MENGRGYFRKPDISSDFRWRSMSEKATRFSKIKNLFFSLSLSVLTLTHTSYPTSKKNSHLHLQTSINKNWSTKKKQNQTMFEAQRLMDLQDNPNFGDPKSWLSGDNDNNNINININSSPTHLPTTHSSLVPTPTGSNVDRVLFKDLVEIVPLVQSLIVLSLSLSDSLYSCLFSENIGIESQRNIFIHLFFTVSLFGFYKVGVFLWWVFERWRIWTQKKWKYVHFLSRG